MSILYANIKVTVIIHVCIVYCNVRKIPAILTQTLVSKYGCIYSRMCIDLKTKNYRAVLWQYHILYDYTTVLNWWLRFYGILSTSNSSHIMPLISPKGMYRQLYPSQS